MPAEKIFVEYIDSRREIVEAGAEFEIEGEHELKLKCPFHSDDTASLSLNAEKNVFTCFACKAKGDIVKLLAKLRSWDWHRMVDHLDSRYDVRDIKSIDPDRITKAANALWELGGKMLDELHIRGVTDEMSKIARLGLHDGRITIPVYDILGHCRNLRLYSPGAERNKMSNTRGFGKLRLYRPQDLDHKKVWICGGELKALVVGEMLRKKKIGAVSATGGEGSWEPEWTQRFEDKEVWVCMDVDEAGDNAAIRIANQIAPVVKSVKIIRLPLDREEFPKGDVSDYVGVKGADVNDLIMLMTSAVTHEFIAEGPSEIELGTRAVPFDRILATHNHGYKLVSDAVVRIVDTKVSHVPGNVRVRCDRSQPRCHLCHVKGRKLDDQGGVPLSISTHSRWLIPMASSSESKQRELVREALGIPTCKSFEYQDTGRYSVVEAQFTQELRLDDSASSKQIGAFVINYDPSLASLCTIEARLHSDPRSSTAVLVVDSMEVSDDMALPLTDAELDTLKLFSPTDWTYDALQEKLNSLYSDIEANVTGIFGRRDAHILVDLAYHSPLFLQLDGKKLNGWLNILLLGDTSQGKSEMRSRLMEHYDAGESVDCKNASIAGVMGGVRQVGSRWFQTWGTIPMHDRRLVFLEEMKGLDIAEIARLTEMRSSGIAELQKIEAARTHARTRLVCISNPRSTDRLAAYQHGVDALLELIGNPEDLRRFDAACIMAHGDIKDIETLRHECEHQYTAALCNRLIRWAWTLQAIQFTDEALAKLKTGAASLCKKYSEAAPLVDRGTARQKLARMAAALAARTFSESKGVLIIRECHVDAVLNLLYRCYDSASFGYDRFSEHMDRAQTIRDPKKLLACIKEVRNSNRLVELLLRNDEIELPDIEISVDVDRDVARSILSDLLKHNAVEKKRRGRYKKTAAFIPLLTTMAEQDGSPDDDEDDEF